GTLEVGLDNGFELTHDGEALRHLSNNLFLFSQWGEREFEAGESARAEVRDVHGVSAYALEAFGMEVGPEDYEGVFGQKAGPRAKTHKRILEAGTRNFISVHSRTSNEFETLPFV